MGGSHQNMRTVLKGCSIRKVEKHCIMGSFCLLSVRSQGLTTKRKKERCIPWINGFNKARTGTTLRKLESNEVH